MTQDNIYDILGTGSSKSQNSESETTRYRYPALRTIAGLYTVFAWVIGIVTIIVTFYFFSTEGGKIFSLIAVLLGGLIVLGLAAISESIKVFLDIEYNTRKLTAKK